MKSTKRKFWNARTRLVVALAGIPVLAGGWWAFRPEKLFIDQQVSEAVPAGFGGEVEPLSTGKLESREHPTTGRVTIYKDGSGKTYLRLTDFTTSNGPDVHVVLAQAEEPSLSKILVPGALDYVELGSLKGNQGDQNYDIPASTDLEKYQAVAIYCERFHAIFGVTKLERF